MDMPTPPGSSGNEDVNAKNKDGRTALIEAANTGNTDRVKALIAAGAYVNAKTTDGQTALMYADSVWVAAVKALIAAGADVNAKDNSGCSVLMRMVARPDILQDAEAIHRYEDTIEALIAAGADVN